MNFIKGCKKWLFTGILSIGMSALATSAWAYTISPSEGLLVDVGSLDNLVSSTTLSNSGDGTELDWISEVISMDVNSFTKYDVTGSDWYAAMAGEGEEGGDIWAHGIDPSTLFFLIKIGGGNLEEGAATHFLFDNFNDFSVINLAEMGINEGDIERISHIAVTPVPLPGAVWLFGSALVALFGFSRWRKIRES